MVQREMRVRLEREKRRKGRRIFGSKVPSEKGNVLRFERAEPYKLLEVKRGKRVLRPMFTSRASVEREGNNYKQL